MTDTQIQELADRAGASAGAVQRRLLGLPVKGRVGERIDRAIGALPVCPKCQQARFPAGERNAP